MIEVLHKASNIRLHLQRFSDIVTTGELERLCTTYAARLNGIHAGAYVFEAKAKRITEGEKAGSVLVTFTESNRLGQPVTNITATSEDYISFDGSDFPAVITPKQLEEDFLNIEHAANEFYQYKSRPQTVTASHYVGDGDDLSRPSQKVMLVELRKRGLLCDTHNNGIAILGRVLNDQRQDSIFDEPVIANPGQYIVFGDTSVEALDEAVFRARYA